MKIYSLIFTLILLLSSCASTYYYSQINALTEGVEQTDDGDFITENDSLLVAYWFNGKNAPIYINVYNKGNEPLYIDWNLSSLIIDTEAIRYRNNILSISDNADLENFLSLNQGVSDVVSFIPPNSRKTFVTNSLSNFSYNGKSDKFFIKSTIPNKHGVPTDIKELNFTEMNTPLRFRSYLTLYKNPNKPIPVETEFYISRLIKTKDLSPKNAPEDFISRGDLFYIEQESKNKGVGEILLGTTLIVGALALDVALSLSLDDSY